MGYGEPEEILRNYGVRAKEAVLPVVRVVFPARQNGFSAIDHF